MIDKETVIKDAYKSALQDDASKALVEIRNHLYCHVADHEIIWVLDAIDRLKETIIELQKESK